MRGSLAERLHPFFLTTLYYKIFNEGHYPTKGSTRQKIVNCTDECVGGWKSGIQLVTVLEKEGKTKEKDATKAHPFATSCNWK